PPSFRASVFAAIAEEKQRIEQARQRKQQQPVRPVQPAALSGVSGAETDPRLPAIRRLPVRQPLPQQLVATLRQNARVVGAVAAMLLVALLTATLVPASPFFLGGTPSVAVYRVDAQYTQTNSASASSDWLVYSAQDTRGYMLLGQSRHDAKAKG